MNKTIQNLVTPEELSIYAWCNDELGKIGWDAGVTGYYDHEGSKFWHDTMDEIEGGDWDKAEELHHLYQLKKKLFDEASGDAIESIFGEGQKY